MSHAPSLASVFAEAAKYFPSPLQQFQFFDKTSRFDYEKGRRETWPETVDRAVEYLCELAPLLTNWLRSEGREMILTMQALPSMRLLAMAGPAARRQNLSIYNCAYLPVDDVEAFPEMLIISMSGCGVGFSVERRNIDELPPVAVQAQEHPCVHIVEDSTEGWAGALRVGIRAWWLDGYEVTFDTSHVRPAGAVLFTKGGRASGPEPLLRMLDTFKRILLARQGQHLRSIDVHDLACAVGDAAVSGGMRRTAMISLYSQGDVLMRAAKTGEYPAIRWNANNSEVWRRDPTDEEIETQMRTMFAGQNGEPGIFSGAAAARTMPVRRREMWQSDLGVSIEENIGTNPCGEITLRNQGLCNLSIAVARSDDTFDTLCRKVVAATIFGTIQATATHFPGLRPDWKRNAESERLLGVDITGQMDCPLLTGPSAAEIFDQLRQISLDVNVDTAAQLGINPAASITTVKPAGNSAALLNCSSGVHGRHARFYVRNARVSAHSPVYHVLRDAGAPLSPENGQTAENATTWVCAFPVASPSGAVVKGDLSADDQLAHWLLNKRHWTEHNPSCFTGDTRFITKAGLRRFDACFENETVEILNKKGRFVPATVKAFGVQDVWELVLTRCGIRHVIHTTKNHLWPVTTEMQRFRGEPVKYKQTHELRAGVALLTVNPTQIPALDPLAVLHGIVYGDGTKNKTRCSIALCFDPKGADSRLLAPLFEKAGFRAVVRDDLKQVRFYGLPAHWKTLPPDTASPEYLRGFVAGWFAADGTCLRTVQIAAKERAALEWLQRLAPKAGLAVSTKIGQRQSQEHDSFKAGVYHTLTLCKETLDPAFFVLPGKKTGPAKFKKYWKVVSAQPTHTQAPVFCVVEPQGQAFCLEGNILTHNCTITYRPEEEAELIAWVKAHREEIGGISFLPAFDAAYEQMPYVEVDEAEYERRLAAFPAIDWSRIALYEQTDTTTSAQELVCTGDRCELK